MTGLASKWATDDSLVTKAVEQDSHIRSKPREKAKPQEKPKVQEKPVSQEKPALHDKPKQQPKPQEKIAVERPKGPREKTKLPSRWADSPAEPELPKNAKKGKKPHSGLPTPPTTAESDDHSKRRRSRRKSKDHEPEDLAHRTEKTDKQTEKKHKDRPRRQSKDERGPLTPAAQALALRIGVPKKDESDEFVSTDEDVSDDGKPKAKYMTPKQKQELANRMKAEKARAQQAKKDAALQEEVRLMFEKMSDKSRSWADIEDEDE